jgi:hypothetical protein
MGCSDEIKRKTLKWPGTTPGIEAQRAGSDLREEKCSAQHGNILQEHSHLYPLRHGIFHCLKVVHHESHRHEKEHE